MRRGVVLDKFNSCIAVMTPNGDFLKIIKDPRLCSIGEEVWFSEQDIMVPGIRGFLKKAIVPSVGLQTIGYTFVAILFVLSGLFAYVKTGNPEDLKGDFHHDHYSDRTIILRPHKPSEPITMTKTEDEKFDKARTNNDPPSTNNESPPEKEITPPKKKGAALHHCSD